MRATDRRGAHQFHIRHSMGLMDCVHEESRTGQTASPPVCQIYWYPVPFDLEYAQNRYRLELADHSTAEWIFKARCAPTLLNRAMTVLRQEHLSRGRLVFDTLKGRLGIGESRFKAPYNEAETALGEGLGTVKTLIHRCVSDILRSCARRATAPSQNPAEIDEKIRPLCDLLSAAEGRV